MRGPDGLPELFRFRAPPGFKSTLAALAEAEDVTPSEFVRRVIEERLAGADGSTSRNSDLIAERIASLPTETSGRVVSQRNREEAQAKR